MFRSGSWGALPPLPYPVADACMVWLNYHYDDNDDDDDVDDVDDIDADDFDDYEDLTPYPVGDAQPCHHDNFDSHDDDVNLKKAVTTIGGRRRLWLMGGSDFPQRSSDFPISDFPLSDYPQRCRFH